MIARRSVFAAAIVVAACGNGDEPARPHLLPSRGELPQPPTAPAMMRTVEVRSPFGRSDVPDNLIADGDFEFTGRQGQPPWYAFGEQGQKTLAYETGGRCFSGIRCASIAGGEALIGFIASPKKGGMSVSVRVKPKTGNCADVKVTVADLEDVLKSVSIQSVTATPDSTGWCLFQGTTGNYRNVAPALYVEVPHAGAVAWVDDAIVLALEAGQQIRLVKMPDTRTLSRIQEASDWIRSHRDYGRAPDKRH